MVVRCQVPKAAALDFGMVSGREGNFSLSVRTYVCILFVAESHAAAFNGAAFPAPASHIVIEFALLAMKLCPQCHFTFDDREQVCDFDGSELTPCSDPDPLADRIVPPSKRLNLARLVNLRTALVGLACVLLVLGTFLIVRYRSSSPPPANRPVWIAERFYATVKAAPIRRPRRRRMIAYAHKVAHRSHATVARSSTPRRISPPTVTAARVPPASADFMRKADLNRKETVAVSEKKDSKVSVVFKKTGNAFKKTFSFLKKPFEL